MKSLDKKSLENFSKNLKSARNTRQLSQKSVADMLDVTTQAVSKWERGLSLPGASLLPKLADLLEMSIDEMFERDDARGESGV